MNAEALAEAKQIVTEWFHEQWPHSTNLDPHVDCDYGKLTKRIAAHLARERQEQREFTGHDHPVANGRTPLPGDVAWTFRFTLEDGTELRVNVGETGYRALESMFLENRDADYQERDALRAQAAAHSRDILTLQSRLLTMEEVVEAARGIVCTDPEDAESIRNALAALDALPKETTE